MDIHKNVSLLKFFNGDIIGLYELSEYTHISPEIILLLLKIAIDKYEPGDPVFCEIMKVIVKHSCILKK